ncbi:hypothetical protein [Microbacterium gallinarum]|uniref:Uncharacterized protein n=1 Tax=Microbacterium gallinarum TaxID=2762209 RepID=A0ABR8WZV3_9MICO|nr:hypothetical protein [Microbacterium gallinarum]MBD8022211.1 hypothetical protein [Microbacterium gallinarum]
MNTTFYFETMARQQEREVAAMAELRRRSDERAAADRSTAPATARLFARGALRRLRTRLQTA